jgi:glycosyltransferase involved in cell wall biosynthesis
LGTETTSRQTVLILTAEPPEQLGGAEHFIRMLRRCLKTRNYQVEVIHRGNCGIPWKRRSERKYVAYIQDLLLGYFVGWRARKIVHRESDNIAAVISSGSVGWYPLPPKVRQVHVHHGTYWEQAEAVRPLISTLGYLKQKWWDSMILERASGRGKLLLVNSDQTAEEIKQYFGHDSTTVWCPLDTTHFRPLNKAACRQALKIPDDRPVGLFVGNIHPMKGFAIVRTLIDRMSDVYWVLALRGQLPGDLPETDYVRIFHDATHCELPLLYASADFSVSPSLYEPFGYVVAESLACGTPVIAARGGASSILLQRPPLRELYVTDAKNVETYITIVQRLLSNPDSYRAAVLESARPLVEALMSVENWCKRFAEVTGL